MPTLLSTTVHSYYVGVLCTATMYLGVLAGCGLHVVVAGSVVSWDSSSMSLVALVACSVAWAKDNYKDELSGVTTNVCSVGLLGAIILVVLSEAALFVALLWALVLSLVAHASTTVPY